MGVGSEYFDLLIIGAGPAGCSLALSLAGSGLKIAVLDKQPFPREKICGDAIGPKALGLISVLPGNPGRDLLTDPGSLFVGGVRIVSPGGFSADIPLAETGSGMGFRPGMICNRKHFDYLLFKELGAHSNITVFEGYRAEGLTYTPDGVIAGTSRGEFSAKVVAGADGADSLACRFLNRTLPGKKDHVVAIRGYYSGVARHGSGNLIELIFLKELLPGYLWIFPSAGGVFNCGMGLRQDLVSEGRIRLPAEFNRLIREHPLLRERFTDARPLAAPETHRIPLGTARIRRSGSRVILAGDAAYLANPLTGGGIGNALLSGMIAGDVIKSCFRNNDFSDKALYLYDKVVNHFLRPRLEMEAEKQQQLYDDPCALDQMVKAASDDSENREALARLFFGSRYPEKSPGGVNPPRSDPST